MDIEAEVRTVVEKNPGIQAQDLIRKVRKETGRSRSTIYPHVTSLVNRGEIFAEKGRYWLEDPEKTKKFGFFSWLDHRDERKEEELRRIWGRMKAKYKLLYKKEKYPTKYFKNYEEALAYLDETYPT